MSTKRISIIDYSESDDNDKKKDIINVDENGDEIKYEIPVYLN